MYSKLDGDQFLLYDSGRENMDRILLFGTAKSTNLLTENVHWFIDGTFKIVPDLFYQHVTIHCLVNKRTIPYIYALLPNKSQKGYKEMFKKLKNCALMSTLTPF